MAIGAAAIGAGSTLLATLMSQAAQRKAQQEQAKRQGKMQALQQKGRAIEGGVQSQQQGLGSLLSAYKQALL